MLSVLDRLTEDLAMRGRDLSKRSLVALFWACGSGLLPAYSDWRARVDAQTGHVLEEALAAAYVFAVSGREPTDSLGLLRAIEVTTVQEAPIDDGSVIAVQDCWICADVCIRTLADGEYSPGLAIEYALEPILQAASERLFGVSQVGDGPNEDRQLEVILAETSVSQAVDFIQWATNFLTERPSPSEDDLDLVGRRAVVLAPRPLLGWRQREIASRSDQ